MPISVGRVNLKTEVSLTILILKSSSILIHNLSSSFLLQPKGTLCTVPQSVSTLVDQSGQREPIPELQFARCMSNRYRNDPFPRCVSCTRRWAGDTCRFQGIRFLLRDAQNVFVGVTFVDGQKADTPNMALPTRWNVALGRGHVERVMVSGF